MGADMTPEIRAELDDLARQIVACPAWEWRGGMLTHTTHEGGYPICGAGTPLRLESDGQDFSDDVIEGRFGPITESVSWRHPRCNEIHALRDADIAAAEARILPDLSDAATVGAALGVLGEDAYLEAQQGLGGWRALVCWASARRIAACWTMHDNLTVAKARALVRAFQGTKVDP